ncbi:GTP-binding protein, partial [Planctomycetota bacterium]
MPATPPGLSLRHTLRGHSRGVARIAWSPQHPVLASPSADGSIRLWDTESGGSLTPLKAYGGDVNAVAWAPDGQMLASGGRDNAVRIWDTETARTLQNLGGHAGYVCSVSWSPDGRTLVSGSRDGTVRFWDLATGMAQRAPALVGDRVLAVAWSPDGATVATGDSGGALCLWSLEADDPLWKLTPHDGWISCVAWSPDGRALASAARDATVRVYDVGEPRETNVLQAHTGPVCSVSFSCDGRLLASKSEDGTVRLWRCDTWESVAVLDEPTEGFWRPGLAFHPSLPVLATLGEQDRVVRIWDLDLVALLGAPPAVPSVRHTTAKIVLVGDSGVGKTGLGWRLAHGEYKDHSSTHGQQFWVLDQLRTTRDGTECEAVLWDLAGQPDYRLLHALFLDDASLALLLFDPSERQNPLHGVEYWLKALSHRRGQPCPVVLVGARVDRGTPSLTAEELDDFCGRRGTAGGVVATSAKSGEGLDALVDRMRGLIDWQAMATTTTTTTFRHIKTYVLSLKESPRADGRADRPGEPAAHAAR